MFKILISEFWARKLGGVLYMGVPYAWKNTVLLLCQRWPHLGGKPWSLQGKNVICYKAMMGTVIQSPERPRCREGCSIQPPVIESFTCHLANGSCNIFRKLNSVSPSSGWSAYGLPSENTLLAYSAVIIQKFNPLLNRLIVPTLFPTGSGPVFNTLGSPEGWS